jgi:NAD(P)H-nitrite reductase large subunit
MRPDEELCLCFHVSQRKVLAFLRHHRPRRVSQLSECYGAGTGCGWCRPFLERLFEAWQADPKGGVDLPDMENYAAGRVEHIRCGRGTPPAGWKPRDPTS